MLQVHTGPVTWCLCCALPCCSYTPAVFPRKYVSKPDFLRDPLLACNDTRLTATQQAACLKCISIRRRDTCLATVSDTFWGADEQSCTW